MTDAKTFKFNFAGMLIDVQVQKLGEPLDKPLKYSKAWWETPEGKAFKTLCGND